MNRILVTLTSIFVFSTGCFLFQKSDAEMNAEGAKAFAQIKSKVPHETNPYLNKYVKCVANNLLAVTDDPTGVEQWEVVLFKDNAVNAFAIPGGKIGVFTGLLSVATTEEQLAAVIGHEIGHVVERHSAKQQAQESLVSGTIALGVEVAKQAGGGDAAAVSEYGGDVVATEALGVLADYGLMKPYGRGQESEADLFGMDVMAKAGYNPQGAVDLWQNMQALTGDSGPALLSTHPSNDERIEDLNDKMSDAYLVYQQAQQQGKKPKCK